MTITIPLWLLWAVGVAAGIVLILLAAIGVYALFWYREFARAWNRTWGWW